MKFFLDSAHTVQHFNGICTRLHRTEAHVDEASYPHPSSASCW